MRGVATTQTSASGGGGSRRAAPIQGNVIQPRRKAVLSVPQRGRAQNWPPLPRPHVHGTSGAGKPTDTESGRVVAGPGG